MNGDDIILIMIVIGRRLKGLPVPKLKPVKHLSDFIR